MAEHSFAITMAQNEELRKRAHELGVDLHQAELEHYWAMRPCWICGLHVDCSHREPGVAEAFVASFGRHGKRRAV